MKRHCEVAIIELKLCESQKSCDAMKLFGKISYTKIKEGDRESILKKFSIIRCILQFHIFCRGN